MIIPIKSKTKEKYYVIANNDISDSKCRGDSQIENIHIISIITIHELPILSIQFYDYRPKLSSL
jgi:selenophosphate synthase